VAASPWILHAAINFSGGRFSIDDQTNSGGFPALASGGCADLVIVYEPDLARRGVRPLVPNLSLAARAVVMLAATLPGSRCPTRT
jgi:hypothetical protein